LFVINFFIFFFAAQNRAKLKILNYSVSQRTRAAQVLENVKVETQSESERLCATQQI